MKIDLAMNVKSGEGASRYERDGVKVDDHVTFPPSSKASPQTHAISRWGDAP